MSKPKGLEPFSFAAFAGGALTNQIEEGIMRILQDVDMRTGGKGKVTLTLSVMCPGEAEQEAGECLQIEGKVAVTSPGRLAINRRAFLRDGEVLVDHEEADESGTRKLFNLAEKE